MEHVKLNNGSEEPLVLVQAILLSIKHLDPISIFELVEVARKPGHKPFGLTGKKLKDLGLIQSENGGMHDSTRNIVISAAQGEGMGLYLVDPRA